MRRPFFGLKISAAPTRAGARISLIVMAHPVRLLACKTVGSKLLTWRVVPAVPSAGPTATNGSPTRLTCLPFVKKTFRSLTVSRACWNAKLAVRSLPVRTTATSTMGTTRWCLNTASTAARGYSLPTFAGSKRAPLP